MKTAIRILLVFLTILIPSELFAQDNDTDSSGILLPDNPIKNPDGLPESPSQQAVFYFISQNILTVYTADSAIGLITITDNTSQYVLNQTYTDLSYGYEIFLPYDRTVKLWITINGINYSLVI